MPEKSTPVPAPPGEDLSAKPRSDTTSAAGSLTLVRLGIIIAKHKRLVFGLPMLAVLLVTPVVFTRPLTYTATTRVLPPLQSQSLASDLLGQVGALAGLGMQDPSEVYVGMLKSRTVADNLIKRFDLKNLYEEATYEETRSALADRTWIAAGQRDHIITVDVDDHDPKRAADLANAYAEELQKLTQILAVTEASQRRLFFEKQLTVAKEGLAAAETALKKTQESTGLIKLDDQGGWYSNRSRECRPRLRAGRCK
jgi:tyrosine-protein kinase Etk/Wzc